MEREAALLDVIVADLIGTRRPPWPTIRRARCQALRLRQRIEARSIPIEAARAAYEYFGNWNMVARVVKRPNGLPFQPLSIALAVWRADKAQA
jgi:hypothetical protein